MSRKKGSANFIDYNTKGQIKNTSVKFRTSETWLNVFNEVMPNCMFLKGKDKSKVIRYLIMKGLLSYCSASDIEKVQSVMEI